MLPIVVTPQGNSAIVRSLKLTRHTDGDFPTALSTGFHSLPQLPGYDDAKPFLSIVSSNTSLIAKGYTVVWTMEVNGEPHTLHSHYIQKHRMPVVATKPILPNTSRLVGPFFNFSAAEFTKINPNLKAMMPFNFPFFQAPVQGSHVEAVILSDGTVEGPDTFDLKGQYIATRHAEHDAGVSVSLLLKKGFSSQQLQQELQNRAEIYNGKSGALAASKAERVYWHARMVEAAHLSKVTESYGLAAVARTAEARLLYPPEKLHNAS